MIKGFVIILLGGLILSLTYCDNKNIEGELKKLNNNLQQTIKDNTIAEIPNNQVLPGNGGSTKQLDKISDDIKSLEQRISKIEEKISKLEKPFKKRKISYKNKSYKSKFKKLRKYDRQIYKLQSKLKRKIIEAQNFIKTLSNKKITHYYKNKKYNIYIGSFESYDNAAIRKRHIDYLGVPVIVASRPWRYGYVLKNEDNYDPNYGYDREISSYPDHDYYGGNLYKVISKYNYDINNALKLVNYLMSKGYEAYIQKVY
ncbi:MAG: hypothetical protein OEV44_05685 [Spirochaetota bacterium]|nr:hypothetical protein [Spirochaetota bacterium]